VECAIANFGEPQVDLRNSLLRADWRLCYKNP
jgi:hypothetical protein